MGNCFSFIFGIFAKVDHMEDGEMRADRPEGGEIRATEAEYGEIRAEDTEEAENRLNPPQALPYRELIRESLYEFLAPSIGTRPEIQLVFFHGIEREYSKSAFLDTWKSSEGSAIWPTWLAEKFPNIRLLSVSYDCSAIRSREMGNMDLYCTAENVIQDLIDGSEGVGKHKNCPLVLVGKDLGCLVIEAVCLKAKERGMTSFLNSLKGVLFYCPPFMGLPEFSKKFVGELAQKLEGGDVEISRNHWKFYNLQAQQKWVAWVMAAANKASSAELLEGITEASCRFGEKYYTAREDINTICRPHNTTSKSFIFLKDLITRLKLKSPVHECQGLPIHAVGLMKKARELEDNLKGISVVGITGMGGVGKTALAKQLFNNISWKFEYTCFVEDVKLHIPVSSVENHMRRSFYQYGEPLQIMQWNDLQIKKTLIIMDDVDSDKHLKCLPPMHCMGEGSVLVVTTRNGQVLKLFEDDRTYLLYNGECLGLEDAEKLFCQNAFNQDKIPESTSLQVKGHVKQVIEKCDGLPLTLEVLGLYLKGREKDLAMWMETIEKLGSADSFDGDQNDQVWSRLRVSYDALAVVEKEMFLDVATFFFNEPLESACATWKTEYGNPLTRWTNLLERGLVKAVQHDDEWWRNSRFKREPCPGRLMDRSWMHDRISMLDVKNRRIDRIWMHEHLRDLGKKLSWEDRQYIIKQNSTKRLQIQRPIKEGNECIPCHYRLSGGSFDIPEARLKHLKYLILDRVMCEGSGQISAKNLHFLRWQGEVVAADAPNFPFKLEEMKTLSVLEVSVANFDQGQPFRIPNGLRKLRLDNINGVNRLPDDFGTLASLEALELVVELSILPENFGCLVSLRQLQIYSRQLESLPESFAQLTSLEILELDSDKICFLPVNFKRLIALTDCTLRVKNLHSLPEGFHFLAALQKLEIASEKLERLPDSFTQLSALELLLLTTPKLKSLPDRFHLFVALQTLRILSTELERLPDSFGQLPALKELTLTTPRLQSLSERFHLLAELQTLQIKSEELERLSDCFGQLPALKELWLTTPKLQSLSERFHLLTALQTLRIKAEELERVPDCFGQLPALKELTLFTPKLRHLPERFHLLAALQTLHIGSKVLKRLPDSFGQLKALKELWLTTPKLQSLSERFHLLDALQTLHIESKVLKRLPDSFGQLPALKEMWLTTPKLQSLSERFHLLAALQTLIIRSELLDWLPYSFHQLPALKELTLTTPRLQSLSEQFHLLAELQTLEIESEELEKLSDCFGQLPALKKLWLTTPKLQSLPERFHLLAALQRLYIRSEVLERLPDSFGQLPALKELTLATLKLQSLSEQFHLLAALQTLDIGFIHEIPSEELENLPDSFGQLPALKELWLTTPKLRSLSDRFHLLTALQALRIDSEVLERLPDCFGQLPALKDLTLRTAKLQSLPERFHLLAALQTLHIRSEVLERLPDSFGQLPALKEVTLKTAKLQSLSGQFHFLGVLQTLSISSKELERLPDSFGKLRALKSLMLKTPKLRSLPERFHLLTTLQYLYIESEELERLPDKFGQLPALTLSTLRTLKLQSLPEGFIPTEQFKGWELNRRN